MVRLRHPLRAALWSLPPLLAACGATHAPQPTPRTVVFGCIGQSNMLGLANIGQHPSLPALTGIRVFQPDLFSGRDDLGVFTELDFAPSRYDVPTAPYDYPVNAGVPVRFASVPIFGPELHIGLALRDHSGGPVHLVKLAPGGVGLTPQVDWPVGLPSGWMWHTHDSWDVAQRHSVRPFDATVVVRGTASALTQNGLTDAAQSWQANEHAGRWVECSGKQGRITGNTADTLQLELWLPDPAGQPPAPGAYRIEERTFFHASLARAFAEGYLAGAAAALPGGIDCRGVFVAQGETDGLREVSARDAKRAMLALIDYLRTTMVARDFTTLPASQVPFVLALVKETEQWPFAAIVNAGYREIAAADPFVRVVAVDDVELGGFDGVDRSHYGAAGQILLGQRMAAAMLPMLAPPTPR